MSSLHNRVSSAELKQKLLADKTPRTTLSFYRYLSITGPQALRDIWYAALSPIGVYGRIYMAAEGVNAQVSVPTHRMQELSDFLERQPGFEGLRLNVAVDVDGKSFWLLKIKVRDRIVADGIEDPGFSPSDTGNYLDAAAFNGLTDDADTVLIDIRNSYEYEVGHFKGAKEVPADSFREQLPVAVEMLKGKEDKPVVMYCTGGIRCEKASAWLKHNGFKKVYHLEGGIIKYAQQVKAQGLKNKFLGKNFVFDGRMGERISDQIIARCHQCGQPADTHVNCVNDACHLLFIQCDHCREKMQGCCTAECMEVKDADVEERNAFMQKRAAMGFNKSRGRNLVKAPLLVDTNGSAKPKQVKI